ncbi:dnaJ-like protein subfamily C member 24-like protein [Neocallimastix lanati (nom. inval.)]|uniref:Diphthamide biosynthesis protein 4 n=1 Tax=Neocallimastix californiae TaxID=1754190 RepID=A0A1Y2ETH4_9FUNG|nr:dnaJ-like protein subfamily C member 24-like protein [Neocallimastix sp. JGI-2020a]ORY74476.1 dnaJ-like protein subfamily C member 24-like protein [Neocallimastix californiae]|eukprot:ORY74476.1 dnaJ-like protein subfamily C member 24-like protein [Neocallimastix californiae]
MNSYEILDVDPNTDFEIIKKTYQKLILKYHPDKLQQIGITSKIEIEKNKKKFQEIQKAWDNISSVEKKLQYDKELLANSFKQEGVINEEIDLDDMEYDEDEETYFSECRCGGIYKITVDDLENNVNVISCDICSLKIKVLYEVIEDEEED